MAHEAYNFGVQMALAEAGLVKEAGPASEGIKLLLRKARGGLTDFFTGRSVRQALGKLPAAAHAAKKSPRHIPAAVGRSAESQLGELMKPGAKSTAMLPTIEKVQKMLGAATTSAPIQQYSEAKRQLLKSLVPYATVGGLGALGGGGYLTAKKLYPKAFGD